MAPESSVLIVGASHAGVSLAAALRDRGHNGEITLVGAETEEPYERPPLSKEMLNTNEEISNQPLRAGSFWDSQGIRLISGERIVDVALDDGVAETNSGRRITFDTLGLATGARPRLLPDSPQGVFPLRTLDDARQLLLSLERGGSIVVIGGGFIGLEVAAACRNRGLSVTVVEAAPRTMARAVAPEVSSVVEDVHRRNGVRILCGVGVSGLESDQGRVVAVALDDGRTIPADTVLVGIGVLPRTELAEQLGLAVDRGIVVDKFARTSDPRVVAAGDCTTFVLPGREELGAIRVESLQNAVGQSKTAAATIMGAREPHNSLPWFWSFQGDTRIQIAGLSLGYDEVVLRSTEAGHRHTALYFCEDRLIAADCINNGVDFLAIRRSLSAGREFSRRDFSAKVPIKEALNA